MYIRTEMLKHKQNESRLHTVYIDRFICLIPLTFAWTFFQQNGAISVPDTVEDDGQGSDGTHSDDLESAVPADSDKGAVKFGWIRGVLVSHDGSWWVFSALSRLAPCNYDPASGGPLDLENTHKSLVGLSRPESRSNWVIVRNIKKRHENVWKAVAIKLNCTSH